MFHSMFPLSLVYYNFPTNPMSIFKDPVLQLSEYNEIYSTEPLRYGEHKRYSTHKKKGTSTDL